MSIAQVVHVGRELLYTALLLSLPTLAVSLVVGLAVSIFQTLTSIQEHTLSYAPRMVAVAIVTVLTLPWALQVAMQFTLWMFTAAAEVGQ